MKTGLLIANAQHIIAQQYFLVSHFIEERTRHLEGFILGYAPGGSSDAVARTLGQKLHERLGQPVVVDFRPGGNTVIAAEILTRAAPDGYTIYLANVGAISVNPHLLSLAYDPLKDLAPISLINTNPLILLVNPNVKADNVKELIALAKLSEK